MKGKERRQVTLVLGNNVFRYRRTLNNGKIVFTCRECEKNGTYLSAFAEVENDEYKLTEAPSADDHVCWDDGVQNDIDKARHQMYQEVSGNPTRSVLEIYEVVRNEYASKLDRNRRFKFLQDSRVFAMSSQVFTEREER